MKKLVKKGNVISRDAADCLLIVITCDDNKSGRVRPMSMWRKVVSVNTGETAAHCVVVRVISCASIFVATAVPCYADSHAKKIEAWTSSAH